MKIKKNVKILNKKIENRKYLFNITYLVFLYNDLLQVIVVSLYNTNVQIHKKSTKKQI